MTFPYQYEPLTHNPQSPTFRLVRLQRLDDGSPYFELQSFAMNIAPAYTALSYCWTRADPLCTIMLNGFRFMVRPNLGIYLSTLVDEDDQSWHYIDAICINQQDNPEKSSQVRLMGDIYRGAAKVVAWLGAEPEGKNVPLEDYQRLQKLCDFAILYWKVFDRRRRARSPEILRLDFWEEEGFVNEPIAQMVLNRYEDVILIAMLLTATEYWSRLWIVQETLLARGGLTIRFRHLRMQSDVARVFTAYTHLLGDGLAWDGDEPSSQTSAAETTIEAGHLGNAAQFITPPPNPPRLPNLVRGGREQILERDRKYYRKITLIEETLRSREAEAFATHDFYEAIAFFSVRDCSLLHDKIYSLLGISHTSLQVDYDSSIPHLYILALLEGFRTLDAYLTRMAEPSPNRFFYFTYSLITTFESEARRWTLIVLAQEVLRLWKASRQRSALPLCLPLPYLPTWEISDSPIQRSLKKCLKFFVFVLLAVLVFLWRHLDVVTPWSIGGRRYRDWVCIVEIHIARMEQTEKERASSKYPATIGSMLDDYRSLSSSVT